jgi:hypothetical protein
MDYRSDVMEHPGVNKTISFPETNNPSVASCKSLLKLKTSCLGYPQSKEENLHILATE